MACKMISRGLLTVFCVAAFAAVACGREPLVSQMVRNNANLMQFGIVDGRVLLQWSRMPNIEMRTGTANQGEVLRLNGGNGNNKGNAAKLHYERKTSDDKTVIEFLNSGDDLHISRLPQGSSAQPAIEYVQTPGEGVVLRVGPEGNQEVYRAKGLWQLMLMRPQESRQHLIPSLELLRTNWHLTDSISAIEASLLLAANQDLATSRKQWESLVAKLGDDRFGVRESADRALRAGGADALQYLRRIDYSQLDTEQEFRVRRIIKALAGDNDGDSPEAAAATMLNDKAVWLALLERPEVATRRTAAKQLESLLGEPIDVNPDADPATQKAARDRIRAKLDKK